MTKNLTSEGREMLNGLTQCLGGEKKCIDIYTRAGVQSIPIEDSFNGRVVIFFHQGGYAGSEKHVKIK
jgi:hypothetical protein